MKYVIGIDLGTSSVKVIAVDQAGSIIFSTSESYPIISKDKDYAEQNPDLWWQSTLKALKETISNVKTINSKYQLKAIGVAGQMHGLVMVDKSLKALGNAIIWSDNRTKKEVEFIKKTLSKSDLKKLSNSVVTNFTAPKLLWVKNNRKDIWDKIYKFMLPKDYIAFKLSLEILTDKSDAAATLLFDIEKGKWAKSIIKKLGLPQDIFVDVIEAGGRSGFLKENIQKELKIKTEKVPIILAGGDAPVSAWASGATTSAKACISIGTAGQIIIPASKFVVEEEFRVHTLNYVRNNLWYLMGAILAAGHNFSWWFNEIIDSDKEIADILSEAEAEVIKTPPGANGLIYLPFINGERSPLNDPEARAVLFGLKSTSTNIDVIKAIMEGVAFAILSNLKLINKMGIKIEEIYLTGGGAESKAWAQIMADVLGKEVKISNNKQGTGYGAALLAAENINLIEDADQIITANIEDSNAYTFNLKNHKKYQKIYDIYLNLYQDNQEKFSLLNKLT